MPKKNTKKYNMFDTKKLIYCVVIIIMAHIILSLSSCTRTVEKVVYQHTTDTLYQVKTRTDSIYKCDSVFVNQYVKGDTVFQVRDRYKTLYKFKVITDTIHQSHTDTLLQVRTDVREVAKPIPWYKQTLMWVGFICLAGGVIWLVWKLYIHKFFIP